MTEQKDNSGVLFKNEKWEEGSKQPPYTGTAIVDGQAVKVAAWVNTAKSGKKYFSLKFTLTSDAQEPRKQDKGTKLPGGFDEMEDSIPW